MIRFEHYIYTDTSEIWKTGGHFLSAFTLIGYDGTRAGNMEELIPVLLIDHSFPAKVIVSEFDFEKPDVGSMYYSTIPVTAIIL